MRSTRPYLIALLALSTVALGGLSWQQYQEIIRLRAAALDSETTVTSLKAQLNRPKRANTEKAATAGDEAKKAEDGEDGPPQPGDRRRGGRDERFAAMRAAMNSPEFQKALQLQNQAHVESHFAALFKKLNLPAEALDKFKNLLAEKQNAVRDAMEVAREQGLNGRDNRDQVRDIIKQTQAELDESIRSSIGDAAYSQYQQYEQTQSQRTTASQLTERLSYTQTPLSDSQYDQLVQTLATSGKTQNENARLFMGGPGGPNGASLGGASGTRITNEVVTAASAYLTTPQLNSLTQLQAEQQAAQKAQQLLRDAAQAARQGGTTTPATTTTTKTGG